MLWIKILIKIALTITVLLTTISSESGMNITDKIGINFIKNAEGFSPTIYKCSAGKYTIGYGHVIIEGEKFESITKEKAEGLLKEDIKKAENAVNRYVKVPLHKGQFNALVSLVYNVGVRAFRQTKAIKLLNEGNYDLAAIEFFDKKKGIVKSNGIIIDGLVNRRKRELSMWEGVDYA
jgi:lysozyme